MILTTELACCLEVKRQKNSSTFFRLVNSQNKWRGYGLFICGKRRHLSCDVSLSIHASASCCFICVWCNHWWSQALCLLAEYKTLIALSLQKSGTYLEIQAKQSQKSALIFELEEKSAEEMIHCNFHFEKPFWQSDKCCKITCEKNNHLRLDLLL